MEEIQFQDQVKEGDRFEFGKNWQSFLNTLNDQRIDVAIDSIKSMLNVENLNGKSFLDVGCGSGLFSLAASKLNSSKIHSVDFDPDSVNCAKLLREKFAADSKNWLIEKQSVLDSQYMESLSKYDVVYSWGVLHHTGNMNLAFENIAKPVKEGGLLFLSIYNDEGKKSLKWLRIKKLYNSNSFGRVLVKLWYYSKRFFIGLIGDIIKFKNPTKRYSDYKKLRGMSMTHDWKDWIGGLPFEVATPEYILGFFRPRGFTLVNLKTSNGSGCNELVFVKNSTL